MKQMHDYNVQHMFDSLTFGASEKITGNHKLAAFIDNSYDNLDDDQIKHLVNKCMGAVKRRQILLEYVLNFYEPSEDRKTDDMEEFAQICVNYLDRLQSKAGGFLIEDKKWKMHNHTSKEYTIKPGQVWFENTVDKFDATDRTTVRFLKKIVALLNRFSDGINVTYQIDDSNSTHVVLIKCKMADDEDDEDDEDEDDEDDDEEKDSDSD